MLVIRPAAAVAPTTTTLCALAIQAWADVRQHSWVFAKLVAAVQASRAYEPRFSTFQSWAQTELPHAHWSTIASYARLGEWLCTLPVSEQDRYTQLPISTVKALLPVLQRDRAKADGKLFQRGGLTQKEAHQVRRGEQQIDRRRLVFVRYSVSIETRNLWQTAIEQLCRARTLGTDDQILRAVATLCLEWCRDQQSQPTAETALPSYPDPSSTQDEVSHA
jgi:hypothetical protein